MPSDSYLFRIYVSGRTAMAERAVRNLRRIVDLHVPGGEVELVDLKADPGRAVEDRILAIPTVVRVRPEPRVRIIGDLSDAAEVREALNLPEPETDREE